MNASLLAFDTSTEAMAVAVQTPQRLATWNGAGGAAASALLLPQIRALLQQCGIELAELQAIAFGAGPGAFTGLRTACAVAQGLAFGASLPVLPLDSLAVVAEGVREAHAAADVDVLMDARMGELYAGRYRFSGARWQPLRVPALYTLDALHQAWDAAPPSCVAGSALPAFGERLRSGAARRIDSDIDRAAALLRLAQQAWRDGGSVDAAAALPLYLRDKVALTVAERDAARGAA
ncbi:MAG TPA: tRNA (adenosine(37)-N6)-threonylcarbamoyltransferase complex dimerization subunit type 1 TsaB [Rubrivivax sp.]|nr:tRNA (adenosine(37)-N6)-threonylcarbamoyltransferase complex dimerization subunit type 1 TsaB [Rubrivivax sp.]